MIRFLLPLLLAVACVTPARAQILLHSEEPLFTGETGPWPRYFFEDNSFGCVSLVPMGVWKNTEIPGADAEAGDEPEVSWLRLRNYGVFHCAYLIDTSSADEPGDWEGMEYGVIGSLGQANGPDGKLDLYAIQSGFLPGSSYLLVAVKPTDKMVRQFLVLDPQCPRDWRRGEQPYDIWQTRYCAVPDLAGLRRMARIAARRPPIATLEYVGEDPSEAEK